MTQRSRMRIYVDEQGVRYEVTECRLVGANLEATMEREWGCRWQTPTEILTGAHRMVQIRRGIGGFEIVAPHEGQVRVGQEIESFAEALAAGAAALSKVGQREPKGASRQVDEWFAEAEE